MNVIPITSVVSSYFAHLCLTFCNVHTCSNQNLPKQVRFYVCLSFVFTS